MQQVIYNSTFKNFSIYMYCTCMPDLCCYNLYIYIHYYVHVHVHVYIIYTAR